MSFPELGYIWCDQGSALCWGVILSGVAGYTQAWAYDLKFLSPPYISESVGGHYSRYRQTILSKYWGNHSRQVSLFDDKADLQLNAASMKQ